MIWAVLIAAQAFTYTEYKDPFTDAVTYIARAGHEGGAQVEVACGPGTAGKIVVKVSTGHALFDPPMRMVARYPGQVRFDDAPTQEFGFQYDGDSAYLTGKQAKRFVSAMKGASSVLLEVRGYDRDAFDLRIPLAGAPDSIAEVEKHCSA